MNKNNSPKQSYAATRKLYEGFRANSCKNHGCDKVVKGKRKRAVITVMTDEQFKKRRLKSSIQDISGLP